MNSFRVITILAILVVLGSLIALSITGQWPVALTIEKDIEWFSMFGSIFIVATLLEQFLEFIIHDPENETKARLQASLSRVTEQERKLDEELKSSRISRLDNANDAVKCDLLDGRCRDIEAEKKLLQETAAPIKNELIQYKLRRMRTMNRLALALGMIISIAGFQILEMLFELNSANLSRFQENVFHITDIFLSGALIAGGSDGVHQLIKVFKAFREETLKEKGVA